MNAATRRWSYRYEQTRRAKGIVTAQVVQGSRLAFSGDRTNGSRGCGVAKGGGEAQAQGKESKEETMITKAEIVAALTRFGPVKSFIVGALAGFVLGAILF